MSEALPGFLFIAMDDDDCAHPVFCSDRDAVLAAVIDAAFYFPEGGKPDAEQIEQAEAMTAALIEDGILRFEGDAPLYLYKLHDGRDVIAQAERQAFFLMREREVAILRRVEKLVATVAAKATS